MMNDLHNGTMIVTGASSGIGRAVSLELARTGTNIVINARRREALEDVATRAENLGAKTDWVAGSAAREDVADRLVKKAIQLGRFHGFVHCAGVARPGPLLWELSKDQFDAVADASYVASYQVARAAFPELIKQGKGIAVFLGSGAAELTIPGLAAYCASKAAEEHLARNLAEEAPNITTIIFRPGVVDTPMQAKSREATGGAGESVRRMFRGIRDRGELISPDDCARALVAIMSTDPRRFHGKIARPENAEMFRAK